MDASPAPLKAAAEAPPGAAAEALRKQYNHQSSVAVSLDHSSTGSSTSTTVSNPKTHLDGYVELPGGCSDFESAPPGHNSWTIGMFNMITVIIGAGEAGRDRRMVVCTSCLAPSTLSSQPLVSPALTGPVVCAF